MTASELLATASISYSQLAEIADRIWGKIDQRGPEDCWEWKFRNPSPVPRYGRVTIGGRSPNRKRILAHRAVWILTHGALPVELDVLHRCDNPPCCNPAHLFVGTHRDNMKDRQEKGRTRGLTPGVAGWSATNAAKTHCIQGHLFSEENTCYRRSGGRSCRACAQARNERRRLAA
jgi:hypothetical protein